MRKHLILYDRDCGLCRFSLGLVLRWDRRRLLRPLALQDPRAVRALAPMGERERMASWHLIAPDGSVSSAGAAAPPLLRLVPFGAPLAALTAALPGPTQAVYAVIACHRGAVGGRLPRSWVASADRLIAERAGGDDADGLPCPP
jgi:predicted DCC family thiol-disulfide oxidoreductase YuxK